MTPVRNKTQLKRRIMAQIRSIGTQTLENVWRNLKDCLDAAIGKNEGILGIYRFRSKLH